MDRLFDWLTVGFIAIIVYLGVRPKSQGPKLVSAFGDGISKIMSTTTGGGGW
jgi:hypothetical protein